MTHLTARNGLTLAYCVALVNAGLTLVVTFGVHFTTDQQAAIVGFVNVAVMLVARVMHLPERTPDGGTVSVRHVPELVATPPVHKTTVPLGIPLTPAPPPPVEVPPMAAPPPV